MECLYKNGDNHRSPGDVHTERFLEYVARQLDFVEESGALDYIAAMASALQGSSPEEEANKVERTYVREGVEVLLIEDMEYLGSSVFGRNLGPLCFDFGDFGIEENSYLLIPYVTAEEHARFLDRIVHRRERPDLSREFRFVTKRVGIRNVARVRALAKTVQATALASPPVDGLVAKMLGFVDLGGVLQDRIREEVYNLANAGRERIREFMNAYPEHPVTSFLALREALGSYVLMPPHGREQA